MEQSKPLELPNEWIKKIKTDGIKYGSATQHEGLGPAIYGEGAMAYAPWLYTCQMNYAGLQAKCDKYEAALKEISGEPYSIGQEGCTWGDSKYDSVSAAAGYNAAIDNTTRIANEALSAGEVEKEPDEGKIIVCNNSEAFRYWTANIKGYRIAHKGHDTVVWLPKGMNSEMFAKEWIEYENVNNPANQKEDTQ
jgi:hypothetical protein